MTSEQIKLVKTSFQTIAPQAEKFADNFYDRLFSIQPVLRLLFPADLEDQKRKFRSMIGLVVGGSDRFDEFEPVYASLGQRHAIYGVREEHYETVGVALVLTLSEMLGTNGFTSAVRGAWVAMYTRVAEVMKRAARELDKYEIKEIDALHQIYEVKPVIPKLGIKATALAAFALFVLVFVGAANAATFTVTKTADTNDGACNADCSLREAIVVANVTVATDTIVFAIPGSGVKTIILGSLLPVIEETTTIDGSSQGGPGYTGVPLIEVSGNNAVGVIFHAVGQLSIRSLILNRYAFGGEAILVEDDTGINYSPPFSIKGSYVGTNATGSAALGNGNDGLVILTTGGTVTIGGIGAGERNVISGNARYGVSINTCGFGHAAEVIIKNNYIGTDFSGFGKIANGDDGISLDCSYKATIGGTSAAERNVISGNGGDGIVIQGGPTTVLGNYIGTNSAGSGALGNVGDGVYASSTHDTLTIGGTSPGASNVISGNGQNGVRIDLQHGDTAVLGNKIGTDSSGTSDLGNTMNGVFLGSCRNVAIGGTVGFSANLISGNNENGIRIYGPDPSDGSNVIQGNRIGINNSSTGKLPNNNSGILIEAQNNNIGEAGVVQTQNVIAGNSGDGIMLSGPDAHGNVIENNFIGTNSIGTNLGNNASGVKFAAGAHDNHLGGASSTAGNTISFNSFVGVNATGATSINNSIQTNSITSNGASGIDLGGNGVDPNDVGDGDTGPNNLQNYPVILAASPNHITGTLNSAANKVYTLEFFANTFCNGANHGEGKTYLTSFNVATNGSGNASFDISTPVAAGQIITATATDPVGNTSEFSLCYTATAQPGSVGFGAATYSINENGGSATISVTRSFGSAGVVSVDYATSNGTATAGNDYTAKTGTLTWGNGDTATKTFTVPITDDNLDENNETVNLTLSNPTVGAGILGGLAVLTIVDNDGLPTVSIDDVTKTEGNQGNTLFTFNISLSGASGLPVSVTYGTTNGTATAGLDYAAAGATLVFNPGETAKPLSITVFGDTVSESDENFFIDLQNPQNVTLGDSHGVGTIVDDDNAGKLQFVSNVTVSESAGTATVLVSRTGGSSGSVSVNYASSNGTATAGQDYTTASGTLVFPAGQSSASFNVLISQDNTAEADETIFLTLSNPMSGATLGNPASCTLTIDDDDGVAPAKVAIGGQILENNAAIQNVFVTLSGSQTKTTLTDSHGNYNFANLPGGGNYLVTPVLNGHSFEPFNLSYTNLASDVTDANFTGTTGSPSRVLRVVSSDTVSGNSVVVPVELVSQGNENSVGFSVNFDSNIFSNAQVSLGTDASSGSLVVNPQIGKIGVMVALPFGQTFASGDRQVITVTFLTAQTQLFSTPVGFGDSPVARETTDQNAGVLPTGYSNGVVTFSQGYEADVSPRPTGTGDGTITVGDFTMIGKFVAGTITPDQLNEFQRVDCSPRGTKGNGSLTVSDFTQAGRFAAALDAVQTAGGPSVANRPVSFENKRSSGIERVSVANRVIRVVNAQTSPGSQVLVSIEVDANGDENGFGFTLNFDANKLSNPLVTLGTGALGASLIPNTNLAGKAGVVVAFPVGQSIQAGTKQLLTVRLDVAPNASAGLTSLTFSDAPVLREVVDPNAEVLATSFTDGSVNIFGPTAAAVSVGGRVTDASGNGIGRVTVSLAGFDGTTRIVQTNPFGFYRFNDVQSGETYIASVKSKQYHFDPDSHLLNVVDETTDVNFVADKRRE